MAASSAASWPLAPTMTTPSPALHIRALTLQRLVPLGMATAVTASGPVMPESITAVSVSASTVNVLPIEPMVNLS